MLNLIGSIALHWIVLILVPPFFVGVITKVKAFFAGRSGPSVFQPYFDLIKLFRKKSVSSRTTTWVFRAAPVVSLAAVSVSALQIPVGIFKAPVQFEGDILVIAYLLALARFFMIAGAMDTGFSME